MNFVWPLLIACLATPEWLRSDKEATSSLAELQSHPCDLPMGLQAHETQNNQNDIFDDSKMIFRAQGKVTEKSLKSETGIGGRAKRTELQRGGGTRLESCPSKTCQIDDFL